MDSCINYSSILSFLGDVKFGRGVEGPIKLSLSWYNTRNSKLCYHFHFISKQLCKVKLYFSSIQFIYVSEYNCTKINHIKGFVKPRRANAAMTYAQHVIISFEIPPQFNSLCALSEGTAL